MGNLADLNWTEEGLLPAIVQDMASKQVLMLAWMNAEALVQTLRQGEVHFWSRSRQELWHKGATSGSVMIVSDVQYDCDGDALLVRVWPQGPACHTGETSCFFRQLTFDDTLVESARGLATAFVWPAEAAEGADEEGP